MQWSRAEKDFVVSDLKNIDEFWLSGLPRCARNDGEKAIDVCQGMDCRAVFAMTKNTKL